MTPLDRQTFKNSIRTAMTRREREAIEALAWQFACRVERVAGRAQAAILEELWGPCDPVAAASQPAIEASEIVAETAVAAEIPYGDLIAWHKEIAGKGFALLQLVPLCDAAEYASGVHITKDNVAEGRAIRGAVQRFMIDAKTTQRILNILDNSPDVAVLCGVERDVEEKKTGHDGTPDDDATMLAPVTGAVKEA